MFAEQKRKVPVPGGKVTVVSCVPEDPDRAERTPLVIMHGGPGGNHDVYRHYLEPVAADRPVYFYDQLGSASSPAPLTQQLIDPARFTEELAAVMDDAGIDKAILLGHSWGACIATGFALAYPERTAAVILSSPLLSTSRWIADANRLLTSLPQDMQDAIRIHETAGTTDDPAYQAADKEFSRRHYCRLDPLPEVVGTSSKKTNVEIYKAMWGVSEFVCTGILKDYDRFPDFHRLTMPVLLTCGRHDEATPETVAAAASLMPDGRIHVYENSAHVPMAEETENYCRVITYFMDSLPAVPAPQPGPVCGPHFSL